MRFSHLLAVLLLFILAAVVQPLAQVSSGRGKLLPEKSAAEKFDGGWSSLPPGARESILAALQKDDAGWPQVGWPQVGELTPSDGSQNDGFGYFVAIDSDTVVVGATGHTVGSKQEQGAAYVFTQSDGVWSQQAELVASDGEPLDLFGESVAISGGTIVVGTSRYYNGGPGAAYVFENSGGTWKQQAELTIDNPQNPNDAFGSSVAMEGGTMVVGAPFTTVNSKQDQGAAYVFVQNGNTWTREAELTALDGRAGDQFGVSAALSGSTAVVGARCHPSLDWMCESPGPGAGYVYVDNGGTWSQQAELTPSDGIPADDFGSTVAVSGSTAVVGSPCHPAPVGWPCSHSPGPGAAYVFAGSGGRWGQQAELTLPNPQALEDFGWAVAINGSTTVIGALEHSVGSNQFQGAAFLYVQNGKDWVQGAELTASDGGTYDEFGYSAAMDGSAIVVAAWCHPAAYPNCGPGAAYVFAAPPPTVTFSPASLSFGNEPVNNTSKAKTVTVKNTGTSTLTISDIAASANYAVSSSTCGAALDAGKTCKVCVTFTPAQMGAVTGVLSFTDSGVGSPQTVALSGAGVADATLAPASATFPKTKVGNTSATKTFTLTNNQPTALTSIAISTTGDFGVSAKTCGTSLVANSKCTISVTFTPTQTGTRTGQLRVSDSASNSPQTANLTGTGKLDRPF